MDAKHYLIITNLNEDVGQDDYEENLEWEIEHDPTCPFEYGFEDLGGSRMKYYTCAVGHEEQHCGLDSLDPDWTTLEPGRYEIKAWHSYDSFSMEYDGGLELIPSVEV